MTAAGNKAFAIYQHGEEKKKDICTQGDLFRSVLTDYSKVTASDNVFKM